MKTRISILGATGYGGGELLRRLLFHPAVTISHATSRQHADTPVAKVHRNLHGWTDLPFSNPSTDELLQSSDIIFGALPHGASATTLAPFIAAGKTVIDLSGDFRLRCADAYHTWYRQPHPHPNLLSRATYGLPELNANALAQADLIASPGCFATAINLALLPAAQRGLLQDTPQVVAMTGSSGSGASPSAGTHHPERAQTLRPYKVLAHQHTPEILQCAQDAGSPLAGLAFTPVSAPLVRGILAVVTATLTRPLDDSELVGTYRQAYTPFPHVLVLNDREPEVGPIAGTCSVELRPRLHNPTTLHVLCAIDNLVKGGAGQAVQAMNLRLGLPLQTGLQQPAPWP